VHPVPLPGVLAAYAVRFPYAWVRVVVPIIVVPIFFSIPVMLFAAFWFFIQLVQATSEMVTPFAGSGIAWWAHIGGFIAG
jgi:membrane associated rhomboid family serine protease